MSAAEIAVAQRARYGFIGNNEADALASVTSKVALDTAYHGGPMEWTDDDH